MRGARAEGSYNMDTLSDVQDTGREPHFQGRQSLCVEPWLGFAPPRRLHDVHSKGGGVVLSCSIVHPTLADLHSTSDKGGTRASACELSRHPASLPTLQSSVSSI